MSSRKSKPTIARLMGKLPRAKPKPPAHLSDDAKVEWTRVCTMLYRAGLMTGADRAVLGAYCQAYGRWAQAESALARMAAKDETNFALMVKTAAGNPIHNPLVGIANKAASDMVRFAAELGMTPSSRSKAQANPDKPEGKKAEAQVAASDAQTDTSWENILPRFAVVRPGR